MQSTSAARTVLAAGALDTPRLLQLSGIGDPVRLREAGIDAVHDLPGVGENFQDHPLILGMNYRARADLGPVLGNGGGTLVNWRSYHAAAVPDHHAVIAHGSCGDHGLHAAQRLSRSPVYPLVPGLDRPP